MPLFESVDENNYHPSNDDVCDITMKVVRDRASELNMVRQLAAECIQDVYRRYRACRPAIKLKRIISCERLVMNMAADTIKRAVVRSRPKKTLLKSKSIGITSTIFQKTHHDDPTRKGVDERYDGHDDVEIIDGLPLDLVSGVDGIGHNELDHLVNSEVHIGSHIDFFDASLTEATLVPVNENISFENKFLYFTIDEITASELPNVKWNGKNDVYVVVSIGVWHYATETKWGGGPWGNWRDLNLSAMVDIEVDRDSPSMATNEVMIEAYNKNLARKDQLIGCGKCRLPNVKDITSICQPACEYLRDEPKLEIEVDLFTTGSGSDGTGTASAQLQVRSRGKVSLIMNAVIDHISKDPDHAGDEIQSAENDEVSDQAERVGDSKSHTKYNMPHSDAVATNPRQTEQASQSTNKGVRFSSTTEASDPDKREREAWSAHDRVRSKTRRILNISGSEQASVNAGMEHTRGSEIIGPVVASTSSSTGGAGYAGKGSTSTLHKKAQKTAEFKFQGVRPAAAPAAAAVPTTAGGSLTPAHNAPMQSSISSRNVRPDDRRPVSNGTHIQQPSTQPSAVAAHTATPATVTSTVPLGGGTHTSTRTVGDIHRVVDEAFAVAMRAQCSVICLSFTEVLMVLDALGFSFPSMSIPANLGGISTMNKNKDATASVQNHHGVNDLKNSPEASAVFELPMLSPAPLAAVLVKFAKAHCQAEGAPSIAISEQIAELAVRNLSSLVEGPWKKARLQILITTGKIEEHGSGRPSAWSAKSVQNLLKTVQLPTDNFSRCVGVDFLKMEKESLAGIYGIIPSLLQARVAVYQHVLRLLEQWWDRGFRPNDPFQPSPQQGLGQSGSKSTLSRSTSSAGGLVMGLGTGVGGLSKGRWSPRDDLPSSSGAGNLGVGVTNASKAKWGHLDVDIDDRKLVVSTHGDALGSGATRQMNKELEVDVAPFHALLQAWGPLNRAYGWGLPLDVLTALCFRLGGSRGFLTHIKVGEQISRSRSLGSPQKPHKPAPTGRSSQKLQRSVAGPVDGGAGEGSSNLDAIKACRWVVFTNSGNGDSDTPRSENSGDAGGGAGGGGSGGTTNSRYTADNSDLPTFLEQHRRQQLWSIFQEDCDGATAVFVPLACLRSHRSRGVSGGVHTNSLTADAVRVGVIVRLVGELALNRAYERFDWWDKPLPDVLLKMAGCKGEIVSVSELERKKRVGVRVTLPDAELVDAIPLEALLHWTPSQTRRSRPTSTQEIGRGSTAGSGSGSATGSGTGSKSGTAKQHTKRLKSSTSSSSDGKKKKKKFSSKSTKRRQQQQQHDSEDSEESDDSEEGEEPEEQNVNQGGGGGGRTPQPGGLGRMKRIGEVGSMGTGHHMQTEVGSGDGYDFNSWLAKDVPVPRPKKKLVQFSRHKDRDVDSLVEPADYDPTPSLPEQRVLYRSNSSALLPPHQQQGQGQGQQLQRGRGSSHLGDDDEGMISPTGNPIRPVSIIRVSTSAGTRQSRSKACDADNNYQPHDGGQEGDYSDDRQQDRYHTGNLSSDHKAVEFEDSEVDNAEGSMHTLLSHRHKPESDFAWMKKIARDEALNFHSLHAEDYIENVVEKVDIRVTSNNGDHSNNGNSNSNSNNNRAPVKRGAFLGPGSTTQQSGSTKTSVQSATMIGDPDEDNRRAMMQRPLSANSSTAATRLKKSATANSPSWRKTVTAANQLLAQVMYAPDKLPDAKPVDELPPGYLPVDLGVTGVPLKVDLGESPPQYEQQQLHINATRRGTQGEQGGGGHGFGAKGGGLFIDQNSGPAGDSNPAQPPRRIIKGRPQSAGNSRSGNASGDGGGGGGGGGGTKTTKFSTSVLNDSPYLQADHNSHLKVGVTFDLPDELHSQQHQRPRSAGATGVGREREGSRASTRGNFHSGSLGAVAAALADRTEEGGANHRAFNNHLDVGINFNPPPAEARPKSANAAGQRGERSMGSKAAAAAYLTSQYPIGSAAAAAAAAVPASASVHRPSHHSVVENGSGAGGERGSLNSHLPVGVTFDSGSGHRQDQPVSRSKPAGTGSSSSTSSSGGGTGLGKKPKSLSAFLDQNNSSAGPGLASVDIPTRGVGAGGTGSGSAPVVRAAAEPRSTVPQNPIQRRQQMQVEQDLNNRQRLLEKNLRDLTRRDPAGSNTGLFI